MNTQTDKKRKRNNKVKKKKEEEEMIASFLIITNILNNALPYPYSYSSLKLLSSNRM